MTSRVRSVEPSSITTISKSVKVWVHDFDAFAALGRSAQDDVYGRECVSNHDMADAPPSAHVKRTAQESFDPPVFLLRRSMPWSDGKQAGLVFVAFAATFDAFERLLGHMVGLDDGIVDGLFRFSRPVSGAFYWCPPVRAGRLSIEGAEASGSSPSR